MLKILKTKLNILIIILFCTSISKADLLKPNESILPSEVVKIQLTGLQKNDLNFKDSGIEQTWNFAHPNAPTGRPPPITFPKVVKSGLIL
jgi:hypothetical protein